MSEATTQASWTMILDNISKKVSRQQFATWFQHLQANAHAPGDLDIRVPNRFFKEWLAQNYQGTIEQSVQEVTGSQVNISFTVDETLRRKPEATDEPWDLDLAQPDARRPRGLHLNEHYTFDTFVIGHSNQLAHAAAVAVSDSPGQTYNPLFMYGSVGLGKSHLLQAICHASVPKLVHRRLAYLSCETFVNEFISAIQRSQLPRFRDRYRQLDLLLIDDIQFLSRAERSQEEFFHTFNDLYNAQKQIVISSDVPPHEITGLQERLTSRFKSGLVARIDPPSYEMRMAILHRKAELRRVAVPRDVIEYIATIITSNIRELDGGIMKITAYASLLKQPITLDLARTALNEPRKARGPVTIDDILRAVTAQFNTRVADLQSKRRTRSIVLPRQVCMYLARRLTRLSLEEIGGYFGGRDHSTVLHAEEKIKSGIETDPSLAKIIESLNAELSTGDRALHSSGRG